MRDEEKPIEYRDPKAWVDPDGYQHCYDCGSVVWSGEDGWVCDHDSAMYEYANPALAEEDE